MSASRMYRPRLAPETTQTRYEQRESTAPRTRPIRARSAAGNRPTIWPHVEMMSGRRSPPPPSRSVEGTSSSGCVQRDRCGHRGTASGNRPVDAAQGRSEFPQRWPSHTHSPGRGEDQTATHRVVPSRARTLMSRSPSQLLLKAGRQMGRKLPCRYGPTQPRPRPRARSVPGGVVRCVPQSGPWFAPVRGQSTPDVDAEPATRRRQKMDLVRGRCAAGHMPATHYDHPGTRQTDDHGRPGRAGLPTPVGPRPDRALAGDGSAPPMPARPAGVQPVPRRGRAS